MIKETCKRGTGRAYAEDYAETAIDVRTMLGHCSHRDRALFEKMLEGYSAEEIAQTAGITSTGIRVRLLRARQAIREKTMAVSA